MNIENLSLYSEKVPITENSDCVICMNTYQQGKIFYLMKCMHSFCDDCSKRWFDFKSVCPLCKTNMKKIWNYEIMKLWKYEIMKLWNMIKKSK